MAGVQPYMGDAIAGGTFDRLDPITGTVATTSPAMTVIEATAVAEAAALAFPIWSTMGPTARRAILTNAATALEARAADFVAAMMGEIGATAGWAQFNLGLAAGMIREAGRANDADRRRGHSLGQARLHRAGTARAGRGAARHCAVERADHPRRPRRRRAARMRQHRRSQGERTVPANPWPDRRGVRRRRPARRRARLGH